MVSTCRNSNMCTVTFWAFPEIFFSAQTPSGSDQERRNTRAHNNDGSHPRHLVTLGIKSVEGHTTAERSLTLACSLKEVNAALSYAAGANPQPRILQRRRVLW